MKKANLTIIATVIAALVISMFAFQPTATEASNNVSPNATPSPRRKRPKTIQSPKPIQSPITKTKTRKSGVREGGANDTTFRTRKGRKAARNAPKPIQSPIPIQSPLPVQSPKTLTDVPAPTPSPER